MVVWWFVNLGVCPSLFSVCPSVYRDPISARWKCPRWRRAERARADPREANGRRVTTAALFGVERGVFSMATHARAAADPKAPDDGDGPLKNGTASLDDSDDSSGAVLAKSRSPAAQQHGPMDGFQDGGGPPSRPTNASASMEGGGYPRSSQQHYQQQQNFTNSNSNPDAEFRPDYEMGANYNRSQGGFEPQQHGGPGNDVTGTNSNKMYPQQQYGGMRPPFSPRGPPPPQQQRAPYPGGSRFVSGPSLSQQTGPTPTLNQLLQAPNSLQRYQHNSYEYPNQKGDGAQHYPGPNNTWGGQGRYPQQHSAMYRNQVIAFPSLFPSPLFAYPYHKCKKIYSMANVKTNI